MVKKKVYPCIEKTNPLDCVAAKVILSMRAVTNIYKKYLKGHDITQSQLGIMMMMGHFRQLPQADLGKMMRLERSTVTRDLKRLVDKGFLRKEGQVNRLNLQITAKGLDHLESILPEWEKAMEETREILGKDGMEALDLVLAKLNAAH